MIKWSRVRLVFSILTAEGLWSTLKERVQVATIQQRPRMPSQSSRESDRGGRLFDYAGSAHVHSTYSDGTGTVAQIARAAREAGTDFILLTDHHSLQARANGEEGWHEGGGVLIAVGTELTTDTGHLLAFDVPEELLPVSLSASEAMSAIEHCGGYGYIALPCDLKDHWRDFKFVLLGSDWKSLT